MSQKNLYRIALGLVFVLYCIIIFIIPRKYDNPNFWVNFVVAILIPLIAFIWTFIPMKSNLAFNVFYAKILVGLYGLELVLTSIFMAISGMPWFVSLIIHIILIIVTSLGIIYFSQGVNHIKNVSNKQAQQVRYLNILEVKLSEAKDYCTNYENKKSLEILIRDVQNSNYNSYKEVEGIENDLLNGADELLILSDQEQAKKIKELKILLNKRNNTVSMLRRNY